MQDTTANEIKPQTPLQIPKPSFLQVPYITDPRKRKESYLERISNGSQADEDYWNWTNMVYKELKNQSSEHGTIKVSQLNSCQSENNESKDSELDVESIQDQSRSPQRKLSANALKWSKTKSMEKKRSESPSQNFTLRKQTLVSAMEQTFQKLGSTIKVRIKDSWKPCHGILKQGKIIFLSEHYSIDQITKVKILPNSIDNSKFHAIKFVYHSDAIVIGLPQQRIFEKYTIHLTWFAAILLCKALQNNFKQNLALKVQRQPPKGKSFQKYSGYVYKKSQYWGIWSERWMAIKYDGIYFYNLQNDSESETFVITADSMKYIWTRFDTYNDCVILKIKHNLRKTELAFPVADIIERKFDWLVDIYNLMMGKQ